MAVFDNTDVSNAISGICRQLGVTLDSTLQNEYQNGLHPNLLSYEKVEQSDISIPAIHKYLIGAQTFLNQPCQYYDIFRACRHVIFIQHLNSALETVTDKVKKYEPKLERLIEATDYDAFEAILFEVVIASNYALHPEIVEVSFIEEEKRGQTPDIQAISKHAELFIECKKFDRSSDFVPELRNAVREKTLPSIEKFIELQQSAVIEISFHIDPQFISADEICGACVEALRKKTLIINKDFNVNVKALSYRQLKDYALYPSPKYYWERYGFREKSEWSGIVCSMNARPANYIEDDKVSKLGVSTWLDDVVWECAVKWKVTDDKIIWRQKRLAFNRLFKGLNQLKTKSPNSILHAWIERDHSLGNRQNELLDFLYRLATNAKDVFAWIIFNETALEVSPKGHFDLIEYSHFVGGPAAKAKEPLLTTIFTKHEELKLTGGEFGIGHELPDIDET